MAGISPLPPLPLLRRLALPLCLCASAAAGAPARAQAAPAAASSAPARCASAPDRPDYVSLRASSSSALAAKLRRCLQLGYRPVGGVARAVVANPGASSPELYFQVVIVPPGASAPARIR